MSADGKREEPLVARVVEQSIRWRFPWALGRRKPMFNNRTVWLATAAIGILALCPLNDAGAQSGGGGSSGSGSSGSGSSSSGSSGSGSVGSGRSGAGGTGATAPSVGGRSSPLQTPPSATPQTPADPSGGQPALGTPAPRVPQPEPSAPAPKQEFLGSGGGSAPAQQGQTGTDPTRAGGAGSSQSPSRPSGGAASFESCMAAWDAKTHMNKQEWTRTCRWMENRAQEGKR